MSYPQNLVVPYRGLIPSGIFPGRMIRVQGRILPTAQRFAINLQCGPNTEPRDNIALHFSPQFDTRKVIRNTLQNLMWGPEESMGYFPFTPGQPFEVILLVEATHFKIAVNEAHYTEFEHRMAYQNVSHITVDGDVELTAVRFEDPPPEVVPGGTAIPSSGYIMPMAYDPYPQPAIYPSVNPPAYSTYDAPQYQYQPQPQTYVVENQSGGGGLGRFGSAAAGAAAGMAIGGLGGYALSNALHNSGSSCSDSD